ncbi:uncharacterized protein BJX67DRAFT_380120 [Aspergillus lucknowensis]|uniref:Uncharacterized protein n=1 Tax=Aspergillus lucknowensis TaxID=176173 RepID=A0ABR4LUS9_9EURO
MCHVQRVINSCGHINDHILMACRFAKDAPPSPEPSSLTSASHPRKSTSPIQVQGKDEAGKISSTTEENHGKLEQGGDIADSEAKDMIQRSGFDARTQPYCIHANIKELGSPMGFRCMFYGCGRAN